MPNRLIIITGQEGAGKSTLIRALLPHTPNGARLDAEDVGQVNPCHYDDAFFALLRRNVAALVHNYWRAGYANVVTGSFLRDYGDYLAFRGLLGPSAQVYLVELHVDRAEREHRRRTRHKQTTQEWRDRVDAVDRVDPAIRQGGDYQYVGIDTTGRSVSDTVRLIMDAIPSIYGAR